MDSSTRTRRPAATALWAHLLKTDTLGSSADTASQSTLPSLNPVDKTGTSARLLLSDTQAQFQKFSESMQQTFKELEGTKKDIVEMKKLFDDGHDRLERSMIDLANRYQSEIQKSMGRPAQAEEMEAILHRVTLTETIISNVDKRLDALQALVQSQTQASRALEASTEHTMDLFSQKLDNILAVIQMKTQTMQDEAQQFHQQYQAQVQALHAQQATILVTLKPLQTLQSDFEAIKESIQTKGTTKPITPSSEILGKRKRPRLDVASDSTNSPRLGPRPSISNPAHKNPLSAPVVDTPTPARDSSTTSRSRADPSFSNQRQPLAELPVTDFYPPRESQKTTLPKLDHASKSLKPSTIDETKPSLLLKSSPLQGRTQSAATTSPAPNSCTPMRQSRPAVAHPTDVKTSVPSRGWLYDQYAHKSIVSRLTNISGSVPVYANASLKEYPLVNGKRFIPICDDDDDG